MKNWKIMFLAAALLSMSEFAGAQNYSRNEFAVSFGAWPMRPNLSYNNSDDNTDRFAPFDVTGEYMFHASKRFSIGMNLTYIPVFNDEWDNDRRYSERASRHNAFGRSGDYDETIIVIMPTARMEWVKTRNFSLYSRVALGLGLEFDHTADKTITGFTFQAVPFGMTIGSTVYARLEFPSFGYQGLFNAGIGYRF